MGSEFDFKQLKRNYDDFSAPMADIKINNMKLSENKINIVTTDLEVELTCELEASTAAFRLYNVFDSEKKEFRIQDIKKYIFLGSAVSVSLGYRGAVKMIFSGYIAKVSFQYEPEDVPFIEITCMDIKGIMMASNYSKQLKAKTYSEAVKEVFRAVNYEKLKNIGVVDSRMNIQDTPDTAEEKRSSDKNKETDETMEMVAESDYEFLVKAAKKFGFEAYMTGNVFNFIKAMSNTTVLIALQIGGGLLGFDISYETSGMVEEVEVRGMDAGKGKVISAKKKYQGKMSIGNKAKPLRKNTRYVFLDAGIRSQSRAQDRADALMQEISCRLGTLKAECIGMPELVPGRFVEIQGLGKPAANTFYITKVRHVLNETNGYRSILYGKVDSQTT